MTRDIPKMKLATTDQPTDVKLLDPRAGRYISARLRSETGNFRSGGGQLIVQTTAGRTFIPGDELLLAVRPQTGSAILRREAMQSVRVMQQVADGDECVLVLQLANQSPLAKSA